MTDHISDAIFLGVFQDFDMDLGSSLLGVTVGGPSDPISQSRVGNVTHTDIDNDGFIEASEGEVISFSNNSTTVAGRFDNSAIVEATITYRDSDALPPVTTNFLLNQTDDGNVFLVPFNGSEDGSLVTAIVALVNGPIESITFNSVISVDTNPNQEAFRLPIQISCFTKDALIESSSGAIPIEYLKIGNKIKTKDNGFQKIRWIGSTTVPAQNAFAPIKFQAGSIGNTHDLSVSPQHRILITNHHAELLFGEPEVLVAAKHLVNGKDIHISEGGTVEYFHILFDDHQIIYANGVETESFHPTKTSLDIMDQKTRAEILTLFPQLNGDLDTYGQIARPSIKKYEAAILMQYHNS